MGEPRDARRWFILAAVLTGTLVGTFGSSVVNVALPAIMDDLVVPVSTAAWVQTVFTLFVAVLMPAFGRLGDMVGYKRIFVAGMGLLAGGSLLAALAHNFPLLIVARVLQGCGNATTLPAVMAIITHHFEHDERGRAMGFWAAVNGGAHGLGPVIGGYLTQGFGWQSIFLFNTVLAGLAVLAIARLVPNDSRRVAQRFDVLGATAMTLAMITLMLNLTQGARLGWTSALSLGLWAAFIGLAGLFLAVERRIKQPFVDLNLFTSRAYTGSVGIIAAQFFCLFGMQLLLPMFLVRVQGRPSGQAGLLIAFLSITSAIVAPIAGRLADKLGCQRLCIAGMLTVAISGGVLLLWQPLTPVWQIVSTLVLLGLGMGLTQSPVATSATLSLRREQLGVGLGIFSMTRFIGASLGSTMFGAILAGATAASPLAGYRMNYLLLIGVALGAVGLALSVPSTKPLAERV
jgi:EmrB/QacA subfamily drug resistance transporter